MIKSCTNKVLLILLSDNIYVYYILHSRKIIQIRKKNSIVGTRVMICKRFMSNSETKIVDLQNRAGQVRTFSSTITTKIALENERLDSVTPKYVFNAVSA
jgi:hypothetical protein